MTILPKKKSSKEKSGEKKENCDLGHAAPAHSLPHVAVTAPHGHSLVLPGTLPLTSSDGRHDRAARSRNSPPHWAATSSQLEETENNESAGSLPTSSKRRNRSSPHHMMSRKVHRHDRCTTSTVTRGTTSAAATSAMVLQPSQDYAVVNSHTEEEIEKFNSDDELDFSQYTEEEYDEVHFMFASYVLPA